MLGAGNFFLLSQSKGFGFVETQNNVFFTLAMLTGQNVKGVKLSEHQELSFFGLWGFRDPSALPGSQPVGWKIALFSAWDRFPSSEMGKKWSLF